MNNQPIKILVVDDEPNNLRFLGTILSQQGYKVQKTVSGQLAINAAIVEPPDLILLDIMMPEMNGYAVCQKLKSIEKTSDIPIIFLSCLSEAEDKLKAFELGAIDYITKPFHLEEVVARIKTQLTIKSLQTKLQKQNDYLRQEILARQEAEKKKDELISFLSHELKTPLTAMYASLGLLNSGRFGYLQPQGKRLLEIAANNTDRLVRLLNNILDLEKINSGVDSASLQKCNIADLVVQATEIMQAMAEQAKVNLSISTTTVYSYVNSDRIIQVLTNLLSNAIKFSPPGSTVWLSNEVKAANTIDIPEEFVGDTPDFLASSPNPMTVLFKIKDIGRGIPSDKLVSIFHQFKQVDPSDAREKSGSGLGLAICRKIVHQYGGNIWVESIPGSGSTFYFTLPELLREHDNDANELSKEMVC
ncbi:MAG TPA: hybrid sensor histidine kinase/response regulator [Leptolyngbyaceae cyanobacterium]